MTCVLDDLQDARIPVALLDADGVVVLKYAVEIAHALIRITRRLYAEQSIGVDFTETVYALDSTTIDLCLTQCPWARFPRTTAAIKLHPLLALRGAIPTFIHIRDGKLHDVNVLDSLIPEPAAFYVMARGYLDFQRLHSLHQAGSFFVGRARSDFACNRLYSQPVDRSTGLICDQIVELVVFYSRQGYPTRLRRIRYRDADGQRLIGRLYGIAWSCCGHLMRVQETLTNRPLRQVPRSCG